MDQSGICELRVFVGVGASGKTPFMSIREVAVAEDMVSGAMQVRWC